MEEMMDEISGSALSSLGRAEKAEGFAGDLADCRTWLKRSKATSR
jgi:hypothetical protein